MKIQISHVNRDKGYIYSQYDERIDNRDRVGLFRRLFGWCFEKKNRYEDTRETYIMETWVTITEERHVALDDLEAA